MSQEVQTENAFTPGQRKSREQATQTKMAKTADGNETRKGNSSILKCKERKAKTQEVQTDFVIISKPGVSRSQEQASQTNGIEKEHVSQIRRRNPSVLHPEGYKNRQTASNSVGRKRAETMMRENLRAEPKNSPPCQSASSAMATMPKLEPKWERIIPDQ